MASTMFAAFEDFVTDRASDRTGSFLSIGGGGSTITICEGCGGGDGLAMRGQCMASRFGHVTMADAFRIGKGLAMRTK